MTTNLNKIVTKGVTSNLPFSEYVGKSGEVTVNADSAQITIHDGSTPGVSPLGGYAIAGPYTAGAGQNQNGPVLTANAYNVVATVNNNFDSVTLPPAIAGTVVLVMVPANISMTLSIWGNGSDTLNGVAGDPIDYSGLSQQGFGPGGVSTFLCITDGAWFCNGPLD